MAHRFYGINQGQHQVDVVSGAGTNSTAVEVNVDLSKSLSREDVLVALNFIIEEIIQDNWPPA